MNDLASAVALGAQMGPGGAEMAAVSKSARVLMLAPVLILFSLWRGDRAASRRPVGRGTDRGRPPARLRARLPGPGAGPRGGRPAARAPSPRWRTTLAIDRQIVAFATVTVSAGIGLHLEVKGLLSAGARAVVLGAGACGDDERPDAGAGHAGRAAGCAPRCSRPRSRHWSGLFALWQLARRARGFCWSAEVAAPATDHHLERPSSSCLGRADRQRRAPARRRDRRDGGAPAAMTSVRSTNTQTLPEEENTCA